MKFPNPKLRFSIGIIFLLAVVYVWSLSLPVVSAQSLSTGQIQALQEGILYFNTDTTCGNGGGSTSGLGSGSSVYILGDSITEAAQGAYQSAFLQKNITANIDASAGRSISGAGTDENKLSGMAAITADESEIDAAGAIVVALGTNGGDTVQSINQTITALRADNPKAPIYWIDTITVGRTASPWTTWDQEVVGPDNQAIYSQAAPDDYNIIPWFSTVDPNGNPQTPNGAETDTNGYIDNSDGLGVHPSSAGVTALVNLVIGQVVSGSSTSTGGSCCNGSTTLTGTGIVAQIINYFVGKGLTDAQAAGILGNMYPESGIQPERLEGTAFGLQTPAASLSQIQINDKSLGWGLVQWTPPGSLITPTDQAKKDPDDPAVQLDFLWSELNTSDPFDRSMSYVQVLKGISSPQDAAQMFEHDFERPATDSDAGTREAIAEAFFQYVTKGTPLPPSINIINSGGGSSSTSSADTTGGCITNATPSSYQNPLRSLPDLQPLRIDEGVDYSGDGPIYAIGDGTVTYTSTTAGWPGGTFISYILNDGPAKGDIVYVAENCTNVQVAQGETVNSSTVLCTAHSTFPWIETGWGTTTPQTAAAHSVYTPDGIATAYGVNFSQLMQSLGAPPGDPQLSTNYPTVVGSLPSGWPNW